MSVPRPFAALTSRERAERHELRRIFKGATVLDGAKANWTPDYPHDDVMSKPVWLIYLCDPNRNFALRSSHVIAVCQKSGRVLYEGSANDEG